MDPDTRLEVTRIADQLERSYRGGAWHGPSLAESLDGIGFDVAVRRTITGAHTIAEIAAHVAFWLETTRRRLAGEPQGSLEAGADWPAGEPGSPEAWADILEGLEGSHRSLHRAVLELEDRRLDDPVPGSDPTVRGLLLGVLQHNAYHGGQIVLLAKGVVGGRR